MDPGVLIVFVIGGAFFVMVLLGIYAGDRRLQGHPTRFDAFFENFVRAQGAGVYPPSLRGNPDPEIQEVREVSRGDDALRSTPGESRDKA